MPGKYEDDEREKKSWREIDASKNKSRHVVHDKPTSPKNAFQVKRENSQAKKALEQFFSGKKNKEQEEAWKKVASAKGKEFSTQASAYVEKFGLPHDWNDQLRLLDHYDSSFVLKVLGNLKDRGEHESKSRIELLLSKLRILKMTAEDPALLKEVDQVTHSLSQRT